MCGLFGWQFSPEGLASGDIVVLATMLASRAEHRGNESWGVIMATPGEKTTVLKNTGSIKKTCRIPQIIAPQVIGHTRKATTGKVSARNAHPFMHEKIIGSHNGFIFDHHTLNKEYKREFEVDSEHLIAHIAEGKPLSDLSGMGTVSYINTDNPHVVYLGRGQGSDLSIYGIGKDPKKPIGIIWGSIGYWVKEALEMAGYSDIFSITTNLQHLYRVDTYDVIEVGEFPLGQGRSRVTSIANADLRDMNSMKGIGNHGYRGKTYFDERDYPACKSHVSKAQHPLSNITADDLNNLPTSLKKNLQEQQLSEGETKKAADSTIQCDGCADWGALVTCFSHDAEGILYHPSIDENLCFTCTVHWGHWSGQMYERALPKVEVPKLSIVPGSTIEYK